MGLIERLRDVSGYLNAKGFDADRDAVNEAIAALEQQQWVSVEERLPDIPGIYWCAWDDAEPQIHQFQPAENGFLAWFSSKRYPTHWMEIITPQPPKCFNNKEETK